MARKATEYVQFKLRIREGLRARLEREADKKEHSTNHEAVLRLEQSFVRDEHRNRERSHIEKDAEVLNLMIGNNEAAADALRSIVFEMQSHPKWDESIAGRQAMADRVHAILFPQFEGDEQ